MIALRRPGAELATRPLHFFWVVDCSYSMKGEKIGALNNAIQSVVPEMKAAADDNPSAQLYVRTLKFSSGASWITPNPVKIEDFFWKDLSVDGITDMGKAFDLLSGQLTIEQMGEKALPPVLVLLTDGYPTDDYKSYLSKMLKLPWGKKAVRIAIAIGNDCDETVLEEFTGNCELVLKANNSSDLVKMIKWASTAASTVSAPASRPEQVDISTVGSSAPLVLNMNTLPDSTDDDDMSASDVW